MVSTLIAKLGRRSVLAGTAAILVSSIAASPAFAAGGPPLAGANCQPNGKISGRGSVLQTWTQETLVAGYTQDVCGDGVGSDPPASSGGTLQVATDPTDPANPEATDPSETTELSNWMVAYNDAQNVATAGIGSAQGEDAISCRTDAFAGTDLPYSLQDWSKLDSAAGAEATYQGVTTTCLGPNGGVAPPFQPGPFPSSDAAGGVMSFPIGGTAIAFPINLTAADCGGTAPSDVQLSVQDVADIMAGLVSYWSELDRFYTVTINGLQYGVYDNGENPSLANCNIPIVRVVPYATSGMTQAVLNFLTDATGSTANNGPQTCSATGFGANGTLNTTNWFDMDQDAVGSQTAAGNNNAWPGENGLNGAPPAGCTQVFNAGKPQSAALLSLLENVDGGIGFVDLPELQRSPGTGSLILPSIENSTSPTLSDGVDGYGYGTGMTAAAPTSSGTQSNCGFQYMGLPGTSASDVGLHGDWALDYPSLSDATWTAQGSGYPVCALTFALAFAREDGNLTTATTASTSLPPAGGVLNVSAIPAHTPASGMLSAVSLTRGAQTLLYTGISGNSFTGVTGGVGTVRSGAAVTIAYGSGGPEASLTANQRRSLYSYFTYVLSDPGQASLANAGYAPLPESWISALRGAFQVNF